MSGWENAGTIICKRGFVTKMLCVTEEELQGPRSLTRGLIRMTYSAFLIIVFNKEDIGKHIALITAITMRVTDYTKNLSLSKLLPATPICSESTESLSYSKKPVSSVVKLPSPPYTGMNSFRYDILSCLSVPMTFT